MLYTKEYYEEIASKCHSKSEFCRQLNLSLNGAAFRKIDKIINTFNLKLNIDLAKYRRIYNPIEKICPVCENKFITKQGYKKEKTVCSKACSNTYFRSGENHGNYIHGFCSLNQDNVRPYGRDYRYICFQDWEYKCAYPECNWNLCLDVHHIDGNHSNNNKTNLIPLCANHHRLTTINEYKDNINKIIQEIINKKWQNLLTNI